MEQPHHGLPFRDENSIDSIQGRRVLALTTRGQDSGEPTPAMVNARRHQLILKHVQRKIIIQQRELLRD